MANTYTQIYIHVVFAVEGRQNLIKTEYNDELQKYITGIVNNNNSRLYSIYANPEHVHFLASRSPKLSEEALATIVTDSALKFINDNKLSIGAFAWQQSASAFSVSKSEVDKVCRYILNQPEHHKKISFAEEYDTFLKHYQKTLKWG